MTRPVALIVPGVAAAILLVVMVTAMIARPGLAESFIATPDLTIPAAEEAAISVTATAPVIPKDQPVTKTAPTAAPPARPTPTRTAAPTRANALPAATSCDLPTKYPQSIRRWCSLIESYAKKVDLDPRLVAAVMLQESGGDAQAYSTSGAVGLMQIMPRDGLAAAFDCSGRPCFASRPSMAELKDPEFNISYGTRMLANLIEKFGTPREALKAYGPMDSGYSYADKVIRIYETYR